MLRKVFISDARDKIMQEKYLDCIRSCRLNLYYFQDNIKLKLKYIIVNYKR